MLDSGSAATPGPITAVLCRLQCGDRGGLTDLMELVYPELRKLARSLLRHERRGHILQPTALVNEAYVRLVAHEHHNWQNRAHFFGAAAHLMRRILIDYARAMEARKRCSDGAVVALDATRFVVDGPSVDLILLDRALGDLEQVSARQARIVELRYFGGLSVPEIAEALGINPRTVDRDWAAARVWLRRRLQS